MEPERHHHPYNCLIVEDEPLAAAILEDYIRQVPFLRFAGRCADALWAAEALQLQPVDVLFLDIHLPGMKGMDFLRTLAHRPQCIFTTAYREYAADGFDLNAVDYLLKPIAFERFLQAIHKLKPPFTHASHLPGERAFQFFNVNKKMVRVWLDEVTVVESLKEYVRLYLRDGTTWVTKGALSELEKQLQSQRFLRVHRSFLVALPHITAYSPTEINVEGRSIPIGRQYKEEVMGVLGGI
jgi:DNA-binding LytR/AlgR family response regulator